MPRSERISSWGGQQPRQVVPAKIETGRRCSVPASGGGRTRTAERWEPGVEVVAVKALGACSVAWLLCSLLCALFGSIGVRHARGISTLSSPVSLPRGNARAAAAAADFSRPSMWGCMDRIK
jgi:hypothetical protein